MTENEIISNLKNKGVRVLKIFNHHEKRNVYRADWKYNDVHMLSVCDDRGESKGYYFLGLTQYLQTLKEKS